MKLNKFKACYCLFIYIILTLQKILRKKNFNIYALTSIVSKDFKQFEKFYQIKFERKGGRGSFLSWIRKNIDS